MFAQNCQSNIRGMVYDHTPNSPLQYANIILSETGQGAVTDAEGQFSFESLCPGNYHITVSHVGCETMEYYIQLVKDTFLTIPLEHHAQMLDGFQVVANNKILGNQNEYSIRKNVIQDYAQSSLADLSETVIGVSSLKSGSSIAKPVIQGLYGNRISLLNNGITQAGQQWGNDHAPEIDPLAANRITIVKGVSTLQYLGSNLGGILMVEPFINNPDPHIHGQTGYSFQSNGKGHAIFTQIQQSKDNTAWQLTGTLKKRGDLNAANYYLTNTGSKEANLAFLLEKSHNNRWKSNIYASTFNNTVGILRGSHIGNITDLEEAIGRSIPFYTKEQFSYEINAPYQSVSHHLLKIQTNYIQSNQSSFRFTTAIQLNKRKEFDIRRGDRSSIPAMDLSNLSLFSEVIWNKKINKNWSLKSGVQNQIKNNDNDVDTGILPLIPNFVSSESGLFGILAFNHKNHSLELGSRLNHIYQNVASISRTIPRRVIPKQDHFKNINLLSSWIYNPNDYLGISTSIGISSRAPAINEMYSFGLHQGVSGIEEGSQDLISEKSAKGSLTFFVDLNEIIHFEIHSFLQRVNNYILLVPQQRYRVTIRGAFPLFQYEQLDAQLKGIDFTGKVNFAPEWSSTIQFSWIEGLDLINKQPLIYVPSSNARINIEYESKRVSKLKSILVEKSHFLVGANYVLEQDDINEELDFIAAPPAYLLLNAQLSTEVIWSKTRIRLYARIDNALNTQYRDYLNRQRYFADDLGRNITIGSRIMF